MTITMRMIVVNHNNRPHGDCYKKAPTRSYDRQVIIGGLRRPVTLVIGAQIPIVSFVPSPGSHYNKGTGCYIVTGYEKGGKNVTEYEKGVKISNPVRKECKEVK